MSQKKVQSMTLIEKSKLPIIAIIKYKKRLKNSNFCFEYPLKWFLNRIKLDFEISKSRRFVLTRYFLQFVCCVDGAKEEKEKKLKKQKKGIRSKREKLRFR